MARDSTSTSTSISITLNGFLWQVFQKAKSRTKPLRQDSGFSATISTPKPPLWWDSHAPKHVMTTSWKISMLLKERFNHKHLLSNEHINKWHETALLTYTSISITMNGFLWLASLPKSITKDRKQPLRRNSGFSTTISTPNTAPLMIFTRSEALKWQFLTRLCFWMSALITSNPYIMIFTFLLLTYHTSWIPWNLSFRYILFH